MGRGKRADAMAYPPRAMRAETAAAYLSMSTRSFLGLVKQGRLPKPKRLNGMVMWDRHALDEFMDWFEGEPEPRQNSINNLLGIKNDGTD